MPVLATANKTNIAIASIVLPCFNDNSAIENPATEAVNPPICKKSLMLKAACF